MDCPPFAPRARALAPKASLIGHPETPEFKLQPDDVRARIGYPELIQAERAI